MRKLGVSGSFIYASYSFGSGSVNLFAASSLKLICSASWLCSMLSKTYSLSYGSLRLTSTIWTSSLLSEHSESKFAGLLSFCAKKLNFDFWGWEGCLSLHKLYWSKNSRATWDKLSIEKDRRKVSNSLCYELRPSSLNSSAISSSY